MSNKLPTSLPSNQTGRHGATILQDRIESEGWIFRRQDGDSDFGVDGEIEIVRRNSVTGYLVKCQVKSSDSVLFTNGRATVSIGVTTFNLWRRITLPTLLFLVDRNTRGIYWTPALAHHPRSGAASLSIGFEETSDIAENLGPLVEYLNSWYEARSNDSILAEIPPMHRAYQRFLEDVGHYDACSEIPEEEDEALQLFYGHVLRLRIEAGLLNSALPTFTDWRMRSEGMWSSGSPLFGGTFDEAMHVVGPAYEEALERVVRRLAEMKLTAANQALFNFLRERGGRFEHMIVADQRAWSEDFHRDIEAKTAAVGYNRYQWSKLKPGDQPS
jgi:hypothetical protein